MIGSRPRILVVDDEEAIRLALTRDLESAGYQVVTAQDGERGLELHQKNPPDIAILDLKLPKRSGLEVLKEIREVDRETPIVMLTAHGSMQSAIEAMRLGAYDYVTKPFDLEELRQCISRALETKKLRTEVGWLRSETKKQLGYEEIFVATPKMQEVMAMVEKVASSDAPTVLLQGESGTGKDLIARAIHFKSGRAREPFLAINCASLPEALIESELFGHERGSFTDAKTTKKGLFEAARNGTIFLDEIAEMSVHTQAKLLSAIEGRRFRRLGGVEDIETYARIIAATNIDLKQAVVKKTFREDLYFRLQLIPIHLPPLRERVEEIPKLVHHFLERFGQAYHKQIKGISQEAEDLLKTYRWPGNIRELKNVIERMVILENDSYLKREHLPPEIQSGQTGWPSAMQYEIPTAGIHLDQVEKDFLTQALEKTRGNQTRAAHLLGITRHTLRYRMEKYGLLQAWHHPAHPRSV